MRGKETLWRAVFGTEYGNVVNDKVRRQISLVTMAAVLLLTVMLVKPQGGGTYVVNKKGNVVALERDGATGSGAYELILHIEGKSGSREKKVTIRQRSMTRERGAQKEEGGEAAHDAEINMMLSQIESSERKRTPLPSALPDGSHLLWETAQSRNRDWLAVPCGYLILILLILQSRRRATRQQKEAERKEILHSLPRFTNQLLLMMNSGVILSDAFDRICRSYAMLPSSGCGLLEKNMVELMQSLRTGDRSAATLFMDMAGKYTVKELMRLASVLRENEKRGSDIVENLARESDYLWENRKIVAKERGKMIDTKMVYPLGMLLILLIIITMAPAMLAM